MFLVLKERLHDVHELLSSHLFEACWQEVAASLNKFVYKEVSGNAIFCVTIIFNYIKLLIANEFIVL